MPQPGGETRRLGASDPGRIHGALGELSAFHESFGIYGDGVTAATAVLPAGWRDRLVPLTESSGSGAIGWCLDVHDLCAAKLYAGRPKDFRFVEAAARHRLVDVIELRARISALAGESERIDNATSWLVPREPTSMSESLRSRWWRARREALRQRMQKAPRSRPNYT